VKHRPKHLLIELPTADEIDDLAVTAPRFEVRKLEFDHSDRKADLNYSPCKGQIVLVVRGEKGTALVRAKGTTDWSLPSGRIGPTEEVAKAAKRVAKEQCGLMLKSAELAAMYDVVWHFSDISIKRLHIVYAGVTDDTECCPDDADKKEAAFFVEIPKGVETDQIFVHALADCSAK
jgi:ADP-ribose pyrophosphatase YjhB (NUDIX family)